jgi:hypothetical protein
MFEHTSRYAPIETAIHETPDGRRITYKRRRFLPQGDAMPVLVEAIVGVGDRLDLITARALGDPEQFWQVCDANNGMNPFELTVEMGRVLRAPIPQFQEGAELGLLGPQSQEGEDS